MQIVTLKAAADNLFYLLICPSSRAAIVIDPGDAGATAAALRTNRAKLVAIYNTHQHGDHTRGNLELKNRYQCPVAGPEPLLQALPGATVPLVANQKIRFGEVEGVVLATPGHTRHHISFYFSEALFCGDTLFSCGCGRLMEPPYDEAAATLLKTLDKVIGALPDTTQIYGGHEYTRTNVAFARTLEPDHPPLKDYQAEVERRCRRGEPTVPTSLAQERRLNPFYRLETSAAIWQHLNALSPLPRQRLAVFRAMRELRNRF